MNLDKEISTRLRALDPAVKWESEREMEREREREMEENEGIWGCEEASRDHFLK